MKTKALPALLAGAALLAACSTSTGGEATTATSAPSSATAPSAGPTVTVPAGLDTGTFSTTARTVEANARSTWVAEGNRMGDEALIQTTEVDPRLTIGGAALRSFPVVPLDVLNDGVRSRVPDATADVFVANDFRVGMSTTRGDKLENPTVALRIGVYRFDSPQIALKVVEGIRAKTTAARAITITGTDKVLASEFKPGTVDSYVAEGPFVVNISGTGATTEDGAQLVAKAYPLELAKVKAFKPTSVEGVQRLSVDRDGIVGRTLPVDSSVRYPELQSGAFNLNGLLHRIADITREGTYKDAGVDLVGQGGSVVYRTRDAAGATSMVTNAAAKNPTVAGIPQLPDVKCMSAGGLTSCWLSVGRYAAAVNDKDAAVARQKAAAQYTILAKNQ